MVICAYYKKKQTKAKCAIFLLLILSITIKGLNSEIILEN